MKIAVLGTGLMGSAFARVLLAGGTDLAVWNRTPARADPLVDLGARRALSVLEAVSSADAAFLLVLDQATVHEVLDGLDLTGKTVVNYTTGTRADAETAEERVTAAGGRYIDAVIPAYPSDIGERDTMIYYAGDEEAYSHLAEPFGLLSGLTPFVGRDVGAANVLDAAWVGGFHCTAVGGFHEAASFAVGEGVPIDTVAGSIDYYLGLLRKILLESVEAIRSGDFTTDQAALDTYIAGIASCRQTMVDAGERAELISANLHSLQRASAAGHGEESLYTQFLTMRP
jgi:3-hydroxyisobutyrate dehydrogenase-like beta-hydroxyacid dehydrogenase